MKGKTIYTVTAAGVLLLAAARLIQLGTVVGSDGFFVKDTAGQRFLSVSLYIVMALVAAGSLALRAAGSLRVPGVAGDVMTRPVGFVSLLTAAALAADAICKLAGKQWMGVMSLLAAVYFLLLAFNAFGGSVSAVQIFAPFALAYPCARLIKLFFDTFRSIKASENIIEIFGLCAMILMMIVLTKQVYRFEENYSKILWSVFLFVSFGALSGPVRLITFLWGKLTVSAYDKAAFAVDIALWVFAILYLITAAAALPAARERAARDDAPPAEAEANEEMIETTEIAEETEND